jgi:hypothetical protein
LLEDKYRLVEAFRIGGTRYWMFDSQFDAPTGRQLAALAVYREMEMRCDREYLKKHCEAMDRVLSDKTKISLQYIVRLNANMQERLEMMPLPDYVYKLASVVFFDETESPYSYDYEYADKKIAKWKEAGGTLDFFMRTPLRDLMPSSIIPEGSSGIYTEIARRIDRTHRQLLTDILSEKT